MNRRQSAPEGHEIEKAAEDDDHGTVAMTRLRLAVAPAFADFT